MSTICSKYCISLFLIVTSSLSTYATDTINTSHMLRPNGSDTVISSSGIFELGFFSPENSTNLYVGIWYKKITPRTVVWVANRDTPLTDGSGTLKVVEPGRLVLLNGTNGTIWSTNTSRSVPNPVAQLLDSGNLVVKDANEGDFLWQSFNYPTDTLLPGMKLGWDFATGTEVYITSPKSRGDPASGDFTFHCDPTVMYYAENVIKRGTSVMYRTRPESEGGVIWNPDFIFRVVMNENKVYCHYELLSDIVILRFTLEESGLALSYSWDDGTREWKSHQAMPRNNCDIYKACGPYGSCSIENNPICGCLNRFIPKDPQGWDRGDWSNGCIRSTPLNCQKGDAFLTYNVFKLPDTRNSWWNKSMTLQECQVLCSNNCSCTAYASENENGCLLWFGDLFDTREEAYGQDIYIRMASSELDNSRDSKQRKQEILILTLSLVTGIPLLCLSLFLYARRRRKMDHRKRETGRLRPKYIDNHPDQSNEDVELPLYDLSKITKATDNFSITNKLGQGGFGPVYKGLLEGGQEIAVKCLSRTSRQGADEFKNEVICIAKLQHRNLVKLLGWCIQGEEMMLVYEYLANRSLDLMLFDPTKSILLDWPKRFNIINGIARGLMYLHQDSRLRVIHRDLKASNILLDSDMNPKISDFGLARTFGENETEANTNRIVGTYGYMSPEYAMDGLFSIKSDVFSCGVIVLEIVSGKKNKGFYHRDHLLNLLGHAWILYREERSLEFVDSCLRNSCHLSEVLRSIHIGLLCVQERPEDRPSMSSVVLMLSNDSLLPEAKHPGFFTGRDILRTEPSVTSRTACSANALTVSVLEAR